MEKNILEHLICLYGIKSPKIQVSGEGREVVLTKGENIVKGFPACALTIYEESKRPKTSANYALLHHWLSFCSSQLFHCATNQDLAECFHYIDSQLLNRAYICGVTKTFVDEVLFITLEPFIRSWSYQTKEQFVNISRWFASIMSNSDSTFKASQKISFSKTLLYHEFNSLKVK